MIDPSSIGPNERGATGRLEEDTPAGTCPPQLAATRWQQGQSGNPTGSSKVLRFKAAVLRQLRKKMGPGHEDELDVAAERLVDLVLTKDKAATRLLVELWTREDGPVERRIAGAAGEAEPVQLVVELRDTREGDGQGRASAR